ncbi:golgi family SNAP receptor complex member 1 [Strigomonas culicis]|uniref:Golgi family SNAP receptor complex member 1 n=1 Tax=Strigomonas culicis TaxID=28005 RepID=S9TH88_9TRYP|nr:golgi family SNAP receptor complex member 1 [Strigomonas culicis]|eukprot:EPY15698.1 golgi family SNAP receptor complex member 1 [Strigomonas culicis]
MELAEDILVRARQLERQLVQQLAALQDLSMVSEQQLYAAVTAAPSAAHLGSTTANTHTRIRQLLHDRRQAFTALRQQIESEALFHLQELLQRMQSMVGDEEAPAGGAGSAAMLRRQVERLHQLLFEHQSTLQNTTVNFQKRMERLELTFRAANGEAGGDRNNNTGANGGGRATEAIHVLTEENNAIRKTQQRLNTVLLGAEENHQRLRLQRERFTAIGDNLVQLLERVPVVSGVLRRINSHRRREVIVLGILCGLCFFLAFLFW